MSQTMFRRISEQKLDSAGCLIGQKRVDILIDDETPNPLGKMISKIVCFHHKYQLGHKDHGFLSAESLAEFFDNNKDNLVIRPVYLLQSDQIVFSTLPYDKQHQDISCLVGFAYITKETAAKENLEWNSDLKEVIALELEEYEEYLNKVKYMYKLYDWDERSGWKLQEENYNYAGSDFEQNGLFKAAGL